MTCIVSQLCYMYTDPQMRYDTTLSLDTVTVIHRTWYYRIHGLPLLHVLVLRGYVTRIMATHLCSTSTRISTAFHRIVIIITRIL